MSHGNDPACCSLVILGSSFLNFTLLIMSWAPAHTRGMLCRSGCILLIKPSSLVACHLSLFFSASGDHYFGALFLHCDLGRAFGRKAGMIRGLTFLVSFFLGNLEPYYLGSTFHFFFSFISSFSFYEKEKSRLTYLVSFSSVYMGRISIIIVTPHRQNQKVTQVCDAAYKCYFLLSTYPLVILKVWSADHLHLYLPSNNLLNGVFWALLQLLGDGIGNLNLKASKVILRSGKLWAYWLCSVLSSFATETSPLFACLVETRVVE